MTNASGIRQVMNASHGWRAGCPLQGRITKGRCSKKSNGYDPRWLGLHGSGTPVPVLKAKNPAFAGFFVFELGAWRCSTLTWGDPTLPSTLTCFTSEFGMGSGGTTSLLPPGKTWCKKVVAFCARRTQLTLCSALSQPCFNKLTILESNISISIK